MNIPGPTLRIAHKWVTPDGHSPLALFLSQYHTLSEGLVRYIDANTFPKRVKKGKHLLKSGELCEHILLLQRGIMRGYVKDGNREITNWIASENCLVTSARGFISHGPAHKNLQATEDCELIAFHHDCLYYAFENFEEMNIIARKILEQYYASAEERALLGRLPSASMRYERFLSMYGHIADRIQLKYIASYLSLAMETLSRIKNGKLKQAV